MKTIKKVLGFSLVELMVTLAIFALIMLFAAPSFFRQIQRERVHAAANTMYNYMQTAQELSTSTGRIVGIAPEAGVNWANQPLIMAYISEVESEKASNATGSAGPIRATDATVIAQETIFKATEGQYTVQATQNARHTASATDLFNQGSLDYIYFFPDGIVTSPIFTLNIDTATVAIISNCRLIANANSIYNSWYKIGITHFGAGSADDLSATTDPDTNTQCWGTN